MTTRRAYRQARLNLHGIIPASRVNGPGTRCVVFFQGCLRGCPGCFNPETHGMETNISMRVGEVMDKVPAGSDGLTVSGGEPFLQPEGLCALLHEARLRGLGTLVYTGFTLVEIEKDPAKSGVLSYIDVLVAGPFDETCPEMTLLARGSTNQRFHFFSSRYALSDLYLPARMEVTIGQGGVVTGTGFSRLGPLEGVR